MLDGRLREENREKGRRRRGRKAGLKAEDAPRVASSIRDPLPSFPTPSVVSWSRSKRLPKRSEEGECGFADERSGGRPGLGRRRSVWFWPSQRSRAVWKRRKRQLAGSLPPRRSSALSPARPTSAPLQRTSCPFKPLFTAPPSLHERYVLLPTSLISHLSGLELAALLVHLQLVRPHQQPTRKLLPCLPYRTKPL